MMYPGNNIKIVFYLYVLQPKLKVEYNEDSGG